MSAPAPATLPPLVEPGDPLSREEIERYSRHVLIPDVGTTGQRRLRAARVLVLGAGGLGSPVLMYLAAAGVGTIGIIDFDDVEASNLQRQVIHSDADVGRSKVESAAESVAAINPQVRVRMHRVRLTADNALDLFAEYDVILDGTDNFATRYLVNDACVLAGKPYVWGSIYRFEGQVSVFWAAHGPNYRDLYPVPPPPGSVPSCAQGGVLGVLCAVVGSVMATEAVKLICGIGESLLGRLLVYDALAMTFRTVSIGVDPDAIPVTGLIDYDEFCGAVPELPGTEVDATTDERPEVGVALSPRELKLRLDAHESLLLIDVREPAEHDLVAISGDTLIPQGRILSGEALAGLPKDRDIVLYCRSGARSDTCRSALVTAGWTRVKHLHGGILAWIDQIEPSLPRY